MLNVNVQSVYNIRKKYLPNVNCSRGGRPRLLNKEMKQSSVLQVVRGRVSIALDVARHVEHDQGTSVSAQIVRRALHRSGLSSQQKRGKHTHTHIFMTKMSRRLDFARVHGHQTVDDWTIVIFSCEMKLNKVCSDGMYWCWTRDPEGLPMRTISQTIKHGSGGIMIWGSMYIHGPRQVCKVEVCINQHRYRESQNKIFVGQFKSSHLDPSHIIFQQDNASIYTTKMLQ